VFALWAGAEAERELLRRRDEILLKLRLEGRTQREVAETPRHHSGAVAKAEKEMEIKNINNATNCIAYVPDLREDPWEGVLSSPWDPLGSYD
jgi:transcriptional regulator